MQGDLGVAIDDPPTPSSLSPLTSIPTSPSWLHPAPHHPWKFSAPEISHHSLLPVHLTPSSGHRLYDSIITAHFWTPLHFLCSVHSLLTSLPFPLSLDAVVQPSGHSAFLTLSSPEPPIAPSPEGPPLDVCPPWLGAPKGLWEKFIQLQGLEFL